MTKQLKNNNTQRFLTLSILVIIGRAYDATTTYLYTPDFSSETNIIVVLFGVGWTSFLIMQLILTGLVLTLLYFYFFKYITPIPTDKNLNFKEFIGYLSFNDTSAFKRIFYKTPKNKNVLFASIGYIASLTLISISYIVGTSTTFLLISDYYRTLYKKGIPTFLYFLIAIFAVYFAINFYKTEYEKYKNTAGNTA